ncbi:MAG TPA: helix-turn-helix domain-containing protein [Streptosporangiaceae bacterium]|nr:helix-turn-helix domain-containing protein [Streptosporangiaceae bacterium]
MALNELQALVEDLARRIGAPVVLEDHEQRMVVYSAQEGPIDEVRRDSILMRETRPEVKHWFRQFGIVQASAPLRIPSHPELGILGRLCVPVRFRGRLLGFLFLIDDVRRLDGPDIELVERVSRHAGLLLYEEELDRRLSASVLSHLLTPDPEMRQAAARQLAEQGLAAAEAPHAVVVVRLAAAAVPGPGEAIGEAILELLRLIGGEDDLAGTVETYLDLGCDAKRTAERLRLHRGTLYYRLAKAVRLTGADLHDGNDRLALHLGFKLARLNGTYPPSRSSGPEPRPARRQQGSGQQGSGQQAIS